MLSGKIERLPQNTGREQEKISELAPTIWSIKDEQRRELNIATGTLRRPIEDTIGTLVHEMCHIYNNEVLNTQDCSRGGTYHNREFKKAAEAHGLKVSRSDKYGYSHTSPADSLLEWCMSHDLRDIELCRLDIERGTGSGSRAIGGSATVKPTAANNNHRFVCPSCGAVARAGRSLNLICGDCLKPMLES